MRPPNFHRDVGGGGNQSGVALCKDNVIDPMGVGLDLIPENGCRGLSWRWVFQGLVLGKFRSASSLFVAP